VEVVELLLRNQVVEVAAALEKTKQPMIHILNLL
jgi:hypothetical protein